MLANAGPLKFGPHAAGRGAAAQTAIVLAIVVLAAGSCAQKGFPPGGPQDTTPPRVVAVFPDSGSSGVDPSTPISVAFDEKMDRRSVEGALHVAPRADIESLKWEGKALTAVPARGLVEGRTYTVLLAAGMKDRRGNKTVEAAVAHFSTGDSVYQGVISGNVRTGKAMVKGVMVWAYGAGHCPPDLAASPPEGVGQAGVKGDFRIGGLDPGLPYCVYGHLDLDADGELDDDDLFMGADSLVAFAPDSTAVSGVEIYLVRDDEPGTISGTVIDSAAAAAAVPAPATEVRMKAAPDSASGGAPEDSAAIARARADSVYLAAEVVITAADQADSANFVQTKAGAGNTFSLKGLRPGLYRIEAFRDLNRDKKANGGEEPEAFRENVAVKPGRTTEAGALMLKIKPAEARP